VRGDVGEMFVGVFIAVLVGEYCDCIDLRYACCWYGAWCCGIAVAMEKVAAMIAGVPEELSASK
jgi:hypothetical protein